MIWLDGKGRQHFIGTTNYEESWFVWHRLVVESEYERGLKWCRKATPDLDWHLIRLNPGYWSSPLCKGAKSISSAKQELQKGLFPFYSIEINLPRVLQ